MILPYVRGILPNCEFLNQTRHTWSPHFFCKKVYRGQVCREIPRQYLRLYQESTNSMHRELVCTEMLHAALESSDNASDISRHPCNWANQIGNHLNAFKMHFIRETIFKYFGKMIHIFYICLSISCFNLIEESFSLDFALLYQTTNK